MSNLVAMAAIALAVLLLITAPGGYAQLKDNRNKNGVRLQGGSGSKGRIELSSVDSWFNNYTKVPVKPAWNSVCDQDFDDDLARIMCIQLGYSYGRKAYDTKFNYRPELSMDPRIGKITCTPRVAASRALRGMVSEMTETLSTAMGSHKSHQASRTDRKLYEPPRGVLNAPSKAPYQCTFRSGRCDTKGPLAGVQCSHTPFPPAPSPPPSPPSPPLPSPPAGTAVSATIRMVGGRPIDQPESNIEQNLACTAGFGCEGFGRVELLVGESGSQAQVWAPLCAVEDSSLAFAVSYIACMQVYDWVDPRSGVVVLTPDLHVSFKVPTGASASQADFNPAKYTAWVTINGSGPEPFMPTKLQDFNYTLSTTPCQAIHGVQCQAFGYR